MTDDVIPALVVKDKPALKLLDWSQYFELRPDELEHTAKYKHGVYAILEKKGVKYFGISYQGVSKIAVNTNWRVSRKHHEIAKLKSRRKAAKWAENICCIYPVRPGTFQLLAASQETLILMEKLLDIAATAEELLDREKVELDDKECDRVRVKLNQLYGKFVSEHGLIHNHRILFENVWFSDIRLITLLLHTLERTEVSTTGSIKYTKGKIFHSRQNFPPEEPRQLFDDSDLDKRITKAYHWCLSTQGSLDTEAIAIAANLSLEATSDRLLDLELVYRLLD